MTGFKLVEVRRFELLSFIFSGTVSTRVAGYLSSVDSANGQAESSL